MDRLYVKDGHSHLAVSRLHFEASPRLTIKEPQRISTQETVSTLSIMLGYSELTTPGLQGQCSNP